MIKLTNILKEGANLNEASPISFNELEPKVQSKIKYLEKVVGGKHIAIFDGIHGTIVDIKSPSFVKRLTASQMNQLLKSDIRWIESDKNGFTIGI